MRVGMGLVELECPHGVTIPAHRGTVAAPRATFRNRASSNERIEPATADQERASRCDATGIPRRINVRRSLITLAATALLAVAACSGSAATSAPTAAPSAAATTAPSA